MDLDQSFLIVCMQQNGLMIKDSPQRGVFPFVQIIRAADADAEALLEPCVISSSEGPALNLIWVAILLSCFAASC